jgi:L-threonylcarbamoyladenylate synthase
LFRQSVSYRRIAAHLRRGGLIAYPTESCYGLGCDPDNRGAVQRLLRLKQRPQYKGLILIAANYRQVARYLQPLTTDQQQQLKTAGAQAITYLMPALNSAPRWLRGHHETLAVRLTAHKQSAELCRGVNSALVSTSANRSGQRPAKSYAQCQRLFGRKVWVLPGRVGNRRTPSTLSTWADGKIIRD